MAEQLAGKKSVRSYRDLIAWQKAMLLAEHVYQATRFLPKEELYGLTSQMRRAAVSIASNIAEGQGRQSRGELLQFLGNARGSLSEPGTQTTLAARLRFLSSEVEGELDSRIAEVGRLLNGLRNSLMPSSRSTTRPR